MSLGTGIFLGALVIGIIAIYAITRDRWNWRKAILRFVIGFVLITSICIGGFYLWDFWTHRPQVQTELSGISLGETSKDVLFRKGEPTDFCLQKNDDTWELLAFRLKDEGYLVVTTKTPYGVWRVGYSGPPLGGPSLKGLDLPGYLDAERIQDRFGQPSYLDESGDGLERTYWFREYNVYFRMKENRVVEYGIYHPERPDLSKADGEFICEVWKERKKFRSE